MITLFQGDNEDVMAGLAGERRRFTLAYLDPPFCTQRVHTMPTGEVAFDDRWKSIDAYIAKLASVAQCAWSLLEPHGSIVVHVDTKVSHYVKVALDELFGQDRFASEIIWRYRRWPTKTLNFQRVHDTLLRYRRDLRVVPRFNQLYEPLSAKTLATWGDRKQRAITDADGRRLRSSTESEASAGVPLGDVWDIGIIAPVARERTGFPTQKPMALLERLIQGLTFVGDAVLDPYLGSGTSMQACQKLGRSGVGIDSSEVAIRVARNRLGIRAAVADPTAPIGR